MAFVPEAQRRVRGSDSCLLHSHRHVTLTRVAVLDVRDSTQLRSYQKASSELGLLVGMSREWMGCTDSQGRKSLMAKARKAGKLDPSPSAAFNCPFWCRPQLSHLRDWTWSLRSPLAFKSCLEMVAPRKGWEALCHLCPRVILGLVKGSSCFAKSDRALGLKITKPVSS